MESLIISLHGNVNNSKFIKKIHPEIRPATPLKLIILKCIKIRSGGGLVAFIQGGKGQQFDIKNTCTGPISDKHTTQFGFRFQII